MTSLVVFKINLRIKGKKFTHPVNVINELNKNIIGIDFIHSHKLTFDVITRQVKFAGARSNSLVALKQTVLPTKYEDKIKQNATYIANICAPRTLWNTINCCS